MASKGFKPEGYDSRGFIYIDDVRSCYLIPLKKAASVLGISYKTARNQLWKKRFPVRPVYVGTGRGRPFFDSSEIMNLVIQHLVTEVNEKPRRGRPTNLQRDIHLVGRG